MSAGIVFEDGLELHRGELKAYCGRMLGCSADAEDAVQETLLRAWRSADRFEGRACVRTWLYRIATNVCIDEVRRRSRRPIPLEEWDQPLGLAPAADPADVVLGREAVRAALATVATALPPRQRDVLLLREVYCWRAGEVADRLGTSVAAVNSALQRARAALYTES